MGTPSAENKWGGLVGEGELPIGNSQHVGNVIEIQLMWELIPVPAVSPWADEFKLAVDIQQNWTTAGIMPADYLDESGAVVLVEPLTVKFNK